MSIKETDENKPNENNGYIAAAILSAWRFSFRRRPAFDI